MENNSWFKHFPGAITVTDANGTISAMNDASAEMFQKDGGYALLGKSVFACHPPASQAKVRALYENASSNIYTITKDGKKRLIYQAPYFEEDRFAGMIEMCLDLPDSTPHFDRDNPKKGS